MRLRRLLLPAGLALAVPALVSLAGGPSTTPLAPPSALAAPQAAPSGPTIALLATPPRGSHTSLYLARAGQADEAAVPVATFGHRDDAAVRGAVIPGTSVVLAIADTLEVRDLSFAASLFRLEPHAPPSILCDGLVHASRPLVTQGGRVFVSRGAAGPELGASPKAAMRVDELSIDEVDPVTGATRTVHTYAGHLAFLAGAFEQEIVVYRVGPGGADLVAVDADTGSVRVVAPSLLPFARDFSVDPQKKAIVFQERDELDSRAWVVDAIDLVSGERARLHTSASMAMAPHALPGGGVAYNPAARGGLTALGAPAGKVSAPFGGGVDLVQAVDAEGGWIAGLHTAPRALPVPFAIDTRTGEAAKIAAPPGARVVVAGFVAEAGGAE